MTSHLRVHKKKELTCHSNCRLVSPDESSCLTHLPRSKSLIGLVKVFRLGVNTLECALIYASEDVAPSKRQRAVPALSLSSMDEFNPGLSLNVEVSTRLNEK